MPGQRAIDIETTEYDNEIIEINGKYKNVNCKYVYCRGICHYCRKNQYDKHNFDKLREEKCKNIIAHQNFSKKLKQWTVKTDASYTNDRFKSYPRSVQIFDVCKKFNKKEEGLTYELKLFNHICITLGNYNIFARLPNTPELRYDIIYQRLPKKIFDPLLNIIIEYLLFKDGWETNFIWAIELLDNWNE
jgi:hypothetical protein